MIRTGQHPRRPVSHGRRLARPAVLLMLLVLVGASVLVSAGSAHHRPGAAPVAAVAAGLAGVHAPPAHEHRYGTDWVPAPGKRLRPAAGITAARTAPADPARVTGPLRAAVRLPSPAASIDDLISRGVLRV